MYVTFETIPFLNVRQRPVPVTPALDERLESLTRQSKGVGELLRSWLFRGLELPQSLRQVACTPFEVIDEVIDTVVVHVSKLTRHGASASGGQRGLHTRRFDGIDQKQVDSVVRPPRFEEFFEDVVHVGYSAGSRGPGRREDTGAC